MSCARASFYRRPGFPTRQTGRSRPVGMFHVKRPGPSSLPDAEIAEDDVEHVLDVDLAREAPERAGREAEFLGDQLLAGRGPEREGPRQRVPRLLQCNPMPLAGNEGRLPLAERLPRKGGQVGYQALHPLARLSRDGISRRPILELCSRWGQVHFILNYPLIISFIS